MLLSEWLFYIKNLTTLEIEPTAAQPHKVNPGIIREFLELALVTSLSPEQYRLYKMTQKQLWDAQNAWDYAIETAVETAVEEAVKETTEKVSTGNARKTVIVGLQMEELSVEAVAKLAEVSVDQVLQIKQEEGL